LTCGTISRNEVFVARHYRHERSRGLTANRNVHIDPCGIPKADPLRARPVLILWLAFLAGVAVICSLAPAALAQAPVDEVHVTPRVQPPESNPNDLIDPSLKTHTKPMKAEVNLVLVPVTITDPMNRLVTGLDKENFQLFEGKDQQDIRHFSSEDAPVSIGVIFDMSGSMVSKIERAREAVIEFFKTANPQDEFFMVAFADRPQEVSDFTSSVEDIQGKLVYTVPKGRTALLDAIYLGVSKMRQAKYQK
jgi:Ca-activated chloride channel family protein